MIDLDAMTKKGLEFLSDAERAVILGDDKSLQKRQLGFRLTNDAISILDKEAERLETDRTKALEILLREIRELRKRGRK
jgi:hypothetical protein